MKSRSPQVSIIFLIGKSDFLYFPFLTSHYITKEEIIGGNSNKISIMMGIWARQRNKGCKTNKIRWINSWLNVCQIQQDYTQESIFN